MTISASSSQMPNQAQLVKNFSEVKSDMRSLSGDLAQWEGNNDLYATSSTSRLLDSIAQRLDDATMDLRKLHPEKASLLQSLKRDTLYVANHGGAVDCMADYHLSFGSGWSGVLNQPMVHVGAAIDLSASPAAGLEVVPPDPLKVRKSLADIETNLTNARNSVAQYQMDGSIYPNPDEEFIFSNIASQIYDARVNFGILHPEQKAILAALQKDMLHVAGDAGLIDIMAQNSITFGGGLDATLNKPIADARLAMGVLQP